MGIAAFSLGICSQSSTPDLEGESLAAHQRCCIAQVAGVLNQQSAVGQRDLKYSVHPIKPMG